MNSENFEHEFPQQETQQPTSSHSLEQTEVMQMTLSGKFVIYSRKIVGTRIEPWGFPAVLEHACIYLPSSTMQNLLLMRNEKTRLKSWPAVQ